MRLYVVGLDAEKNKFVVTNAAEYLQAIPLNIVTSLHAHAFETRRGALFALEKIRLSRGDLAWSVVSYKDFRRLAGLARRRAPNRVFKTYASATHKEDVDD